MHVAEAPATREELCAALAAAGEAGTPVRFRGGGTKLGWPPAAPPDAIELSTAGLTRIVEHNAGDLTAVLEAGVPLAEAQALFAKEGQRLALDPPDGGATIGGVVASGDTGPLRGRYGGPRDLVVGHARRALRRHAREERRQGDQERGGLRHRQAVRRARSARSARSWRCRCGSTRSRPHTATALGEARDPDELARGAAAIGQSPLEHHGIDVALGRRPGRVLARFAGAVPRPQAEAAERLLRDEGLAHRDRRRRRAALGRAARRPARPARGEGLRASHPPARSSCGRRTSSAARSWAARRWGCRGCASRSRRAEARGAAAARLHRGRAGPPGGPRRGPDRPDRTRPPAR